MTMPYQIITDSSCDLPQELADAYGLIVLPLSVTVDGVTYKYYLDGREIGFHTLYEKYRSGSKTSTCAVNPDAFVDVLEPCLKEGKDVFYIGFSSGLSATYQSGCIAAAELREKYPERKIMTIDSLCASLGQGLFVHYAVQKQREGATMEELAAYLEELRPHLCHWFTVDDLMYLKRGGRISASTALLGTALQIKPVMHTDNDGKLANVSKARGRKASIRALVDRMEQTAIDPSSQTVFICHGDCIEDAEYAASLIRERFGIQDIVINYTGPVIGAHSGPGTLAIFFIGTER